MAGPWEKYVASPAGPPLSAPITLGHPDPFKVRDQALQEEAAARARQTQPLEIESKTANIQQSQTGIRDTNFDNVNTLRKQFETEQPVQDFKTILPLADSAFKLGPNKAGDLNLVYAFGKVMDPGSVVREGEQVMATNVGGVSEKVKGYLEQINGGAGLTPIQRTQLTEEIRNRGRALAATYNQRRAFYEDFARRNGINPEDVVGPHPAAPFMADEDKYIQEHGGTPRRGGIEQVGSTATTEKGFGLQQDPRVSELSAPQKAAYEAWWGANPDPSADQLRQFLGTIGVSGNLTNAEEIIKAHKEGRGLSSDIATTPDISDARGGGGILETADAAVRGAADTVSLGLADKIAAVSDTITNPGTSFDQNAARQYAISDYDAQSHPVARPVGQIAGGFALPLGDVSTLPQLALKGAGYGAAYGVGSSRSLAEVPQNAFLGGAAGAAIPTALVGAGRGAGAAIRGISRKPGEIPPLVDPVTGELNQPMDAMRPAERVGEMRGYGLNTITPGMAGGRSARIVEQGFNNLPGSAGIMEDVNSAAAKELRGAAQGVAQRFGTSKTLNEGGSELQRGAQEWMTRFDQTTSKAYNAIPISPKAPANLTNTTATLERLGAKVESNPDLAEEIKDPTLLKYLDAINKNGLDWQGLKEFRTFVGNKIGQFRFSEDARTGDYRSLYAALSEDMRASASAQGPKALRAFERANSIKAQGEQRIDQALSRILGPNAQGSPEKAAAAVQAMTRGGKSTGDLKQLAQIKAATVKSGAWDEIASTLIHLGGQPATSEGRAFQPQTFVQWYADMAEPARRMLFKPEQRKALDGFVAMTQQLGRVRGLSNTSNTGSAMFGGGTLLTAAAAFLNPVLGLKLGGTLAANYALGKAWTNPKFVNIVTGYTRAAAQGNQNAVKSQVGRLTKLATTNPELRAAVEAMLKKLANDNSPLTSAAASPETQPDQNQ